LFSPQTPGTVTVVEEEALETESDEKEEDDVNI
jgi:hypothetical protein